MEAGVNVKPSSKLRTLCVFSMFLLSSGCDAPRAAVAAPTASKPQFSEPAVIGKIVDAETGQPIEGALVYGHYSTSSGTVAGGRKFGEAVKSFLVQTGANGEFRLEAWDSGNREISGVGGDRFPYIGIYKPGYDFWFDRLNSIAQWRPKAASAGTAVTLPDGTRDWRALPHRLKPAKTEQARYFALDLSGSPMMTIGECGWEIYAPLFLAQHNELKEFIRRNVRPEDILPSGYIKTGRPWPDVAFANFNATAVDKLKNSHAERPGSWRCANPLVVFVEAK